MNRDHVQVCGHDLLQVLEHTRPGERLAFKQLVQKTRLLAQRPVLRLIEERFGLPLLTVVSGDLRLHA